MIPDRVAVILAFPLLNVVLANPGNPTVLMVATVTSEEFHTTEVVRSCALPSVKWPVAKNCCSRPATTVAETGVTTMDSSTTGVTVSVVEAEMVPDVAFMVVEPTPCDVASPFIPPALLILATVVAEEFQVTDDVRFCVVASENVPVAMNCFVLPRAMLWLTGVTVRDDRTAGVTTSVAGPEGTALNDEVMVAVPTVTAVALPVEPAVLLMVATPELDVAQVTKVVKVWVSPSASVPVAANCCIVPLAMLAVAGVTAIDARAEDVSVAVPETPV